MASLRKHNHSSGSKDLTNNPLLKLQQEVNHAMNDFYHLFEPISTGLGKFEKILISPPLDLVEDKECYKLEVEMPGMGIEDIQVSCDGNKIIIQGEKSTSKKDEKKNFISREICYGRYDRSIALPLAADVERATASFKKGMLWVTIPKKSGSKSICKKLKVQEAK